MPSLISLRAQTDALATRNKTRQSTRRGGHFPRALRASRFPWMSIARQERLLWTTLGLAFGAASYVNLRVRPRGALSGRTRAAKTTRFDASLRSFPRPPPPPTRPSVASSSRRLADRLPRPILSQRSLWSSTSALADKFPSPPPPQPPLPVRRPIALDRSTDRSRNQQRGLVYFLDALRFPSRRRRLTSPPPHPAPQLAPAPILSPRRTSPCSARPRRTGSDARGTRAWTASSETSSSF